MATVKTRADDERTLMVLHLSEHGDGLSASVVAKRFGISRNAVLGLRHRTLKDLAASEADPTYGPPASRPENQDGAMGPLWWFQGRKAA